MYSARRAGWIPALVFLCVMVISCEWIRENRETCPCTLAVELKDLPAWPVMLYVDGAPAGVASHDTTLMVRVEKGPSATVTAVSGARLQDDGTVRIPEGISCPALYTFTGVADCSGESAFLPVRMRKQFCTLSLAFLAPSGWGPPYRTRVRGAAGGLDLAGDVPLDGAFRCSLDGEYRCRLPRQEPSAPLWLDIALADSVLRSFPLDEYLRRAEYDWQAPDLGDVTLEVNLSITGIGFRMGNWHAEIPVEVVI